MIQVLAVFKKASTTAVRPYTGEWVRKLRATVLRHLPMEHQFSVLSDVPVEGIDCVPLLHNFPGWWSKLELFRPDLPISPGTRCLFLDLDCVVLGDLSPLVSGTGPKMTPNTRRDYPLRWPRGGKIGVKHYRTGCMVWDHGDLKAAWTGFSLDSARIMATYHGDQDYLGRQFPDLPKMPEEWFRLLRFCRPEYPPPGVKVVFCNPWKNHVAIRRFPWVQRAWEAHWGGPKREGILLEDTG